MRKDGSFRPGFKGTESYEPFSRTSNYNNLLSNQEEKFFSLKTDNLLKIVIIGTLEQNWSSFLHSKGF